MKLSAFTQGRENNFNLIRIVAALAVLVTHSFVLATGSGDAEPLRNSLGVTLGSIAVDIFFITSGFLVTASLLNRQNIIEFLWARILRIFPALLVMLLLTVFVLGVFFTSLPPLTYLTRPGTYTYFLRGVILVKGVAFSLPGVFERNPYKGSVNGSLWTMPYEVRMYLVLALLWFAVQLIAKKNVKLFKIAVLTCFAASCVMVIARPTQATMENASVKLFFMFFTGAAFYVLKEQIRLYHGLFWLCLIALIGSAVWYKPAFPAIYFLTVAFSSPFSSFTWRTYPSGPSGNTIWSEITRMAFTSTLFPSSKPWWRSCRGCRFSPCF